jgi:hypothetical protein
LLAHLLTSWLLLVVLEVVVILVAVEALEVIEPLLEHQAAVHLPKQN